MTCKQVIFTVTDSSQAEKIEACLSLCQDVLAISFRDGADQPILEPALGTTPLWDKTEIVVLFETEEALLSILSSINIELGSTPPYFLEELPDQAWERICLSQMKPIQFDNRLCICPSWCEPPSPTCPTLMLDPGLAFGTGTHATTHLCLNWISKTDLKNKIVMDYGCGSGILGLAALLLGAKHIIAVDIDPQALLACKENAARNHLDLNHVVCCLPERIPDLQPDIIIANILASPLIELAPHFFTLLAPNGQIVLSGILSEQAELITKHYHPFFDLTPPQIENGWLCFNGKRRPKKLE